MIINIGGRCDIVDCYTEWLIKRFEEGYVFTRNPLFPNRVTRYELRPDTVDAVLFCSKNYSKLLPHVKEIAEKFRTYFHYTITAYGKDFEPNIPSREESIQTLIALSRTVGREKVGWRYDPILLTKEYTVERHFEIFEELAGKLSPYIDRCVFSFVEMNSTLRANISDLVSLDYERKKRLAEGLGRIAKQYSMKLQTCGDSGEYPEYGIGKSGCVTLDMLGRANGCLFRETKHKGNRRGCACIESRDLGFYDSCPNKCKYCYTNKDYELIAQNRKNHDVNSPLLIGHFNADDVFLQGNQTSFLKGEFNQLSLFD